MRKIPTRLGSTNFCTCRPVLHRVFANQQTVPNAAKLVRNTPEHEFRIQSGGSGAFVAKNSNATSCTNFCASLTRFALSIGRQPNSPKCTQIVQKARKQEFRVQWGGCGAFIAKNSYTTLWHKLLHQFDPFCTECCKATKGSKMNPNSTKCTKM